MTLTFDFYDNLKFFKVEFETESIQRNRIMSIQLDGFSLDIPDFIDMHHDLYIRIMYEVKSQSQTFWNTVNGEITGIPTLDYQPKPTMATKAIDAVIKYSMPVIFLLFSSYLFAQPSSFIVFGAQAGYAAKYHSAVGGFFGGYKFSNNYVGLNANIPFTSERSVPTATAGIEYGYGIGSFVPYVSGQYYSCGKEAISEGEGTQGFEFGAGISYCPEWVPLKFSVGLKGLEKLSQVKDFTNYANVSLGIYKTF